MDRRPVIWYALGAPGRPLVVAADEQMPQQDLLALVRQLVVQGVLPGGTKCFLHASQIGRRPSVTIVLPPGTDFLTVLGGLHNATLARWREGGPWGGAMVGVMMVDRYEDCLRAARRVG